MPDTSQMPLNEVQHRASGIIVNSTGYSDAETFSRPNNTTAYDAGDVLGANTGSTAALQFVVAGRTGQEVLITSAQLEIDVTAIPSGMTSFRLHLYNVTPPSAYGDAATWDLPSGDRASYLGYIDLGAPADLGSTLYCEINQLNKQVTLSTASLFGYLVTASGYTPTAQAVHKVTLHTIGL